MRPRRPRQMLHDTLPTHCIDLGAGFIRQQLVDDTLVQAQLAAVRCDFEHIVLGGVHRAAVYQGGTLGECLHHFLLLLGGLGHDVVVLHLRRGQVKLIGGFDVRHLFEKVHQLREIEKLGEAGARSVAGALRGQLQRRHSLTKARCPAVKMGHVQFLQAVILEVPLHGVKLSHTVRHRSTGGKDNAPASGNLIHVATLGEHITGLLWASAGGEARHIPHFGVKKQVLVVVCLVHKQPIHAQLLESHHIVLTVPRPGAFPVVTSRDFLVRSSCLTVKRSPPLNVHLGYALGDLVNLLLQGAFPGAHG